MWPKAAVVLVSNDPKTAMCQNAAVGEGVVQGLTFLDAPNLPKNPVYDAHQLLLLLRGHLGDVVHHCTTTRNCQRISIAVMKFRIECLLTPLNVDSASPAVEWFSGATGESCVDVQGHGVLYCVATKGKQIGGGATTAHKPCFTAPVTPGNRAPCDRPQ